MINYSDSYLLASANNIRTEVPILGKNTDAAFYGITISIFYLANQMDDYSIRNFVMERLR